MSPPFFSALVLWDREEKKKEEKKRGRISLEGDRRTRWPRGPFQSAGCPSNSLARVAVQRSGDAARPGNRLHLVRSTEKRERERGGHDDFWAKRERETERNQSTSTEEGIGFDPVGTWRDIESLCSTLSLCSYTRNCRRDYSWRWWSSSSSSSQPARRGGFLFKSPAGWGVAYRSG